MTETSLYGISNCDTVKKARTWLDDHGVAYLFHDYKKSGVNVSLLRGWVDRVGWEPLLNRAGTTFRKLLDADKIDIDAQKAIALMLANPSVIKRPVLVRDDTIIVGFDPVRYDMLA